MESYKHLTPICTYACIYKYTKVNGMKSLGKGLKGCAPNERADFRGGRDQEILALPVPFVLLDENALCETEN